MMGNMWFFDLMDTIFPFLFLGTFFIIVCTMVYSVIIGFSPKARSKMMSRQIKATHYMMDDMKDELEDITDISSDLSAKAVKKTTQAIVEGINEGKTNKGIHCKYCGKTIDADSRYCKHCGERL